MAKVTVTFEDSEEDGIVKTAVDFGEAVDADSPGTPAMQLAMEMLKMLRDPEKFIEGAKSHESA